MTVTDEARTLARLAGVSSQQMQRAMDARDLVDRAERRRRPLAALETATRRLPAYARRLLAEDDKRAATLAAIELGLADADQPMSVALAELQQLALADQVTSAPQPAAPVKPTAAAAKPRHEGARGKLTEASQKALDLLEDGSMDRDYLLDRLTPHVRDRRGAAAVVTNLIRTGWLTDTDDRIEIAEAPHA